MHSDNMIREVSNKKTKPIQQTKNETVDELIYQQTETFISDTLSKANM